MRRIQWTDEGVSLALCWMAIDDRKGNPNRPSLPGCLYGNVIAPFLQFRGAVADQLYVIGGRDHQQDPLSLVEMFDSWNWRWVTCPPMTTRRAGCAAAALPDGQLLVVGGYDERGIVRGVLASCEAFDPMKQVWGHGCADLRRARWGHGCAVLDGLVYVVGGCALRAGGPPGEDLMETLRTCETYDAADGTWHTCPSLHVARAGARLVVLGGRQLAAVGGCDDVFGRAEMLSSVELYDPGTRRWSLLDAHLAIPRTTAAAAAIDGQRILVTGGAPSLASAEVYHMPGASGGSCFRNQREDEMRGSRPICDMAEGRMGCQAVVMTLPSGDRRTPQRPRRCVVVVGGENGDEDWESDAALVRQFSSVLVYDADSGEWRAKDAFPPIPTARTAMAICLAPGRVSGHAD